MHYEIVLNIYLHKCTSVKSTVALDKKILW